MSNPRILVLTLLTALILTQKSEAQEKALAKLTLDAGRSQMTVHVFRSGLFAFAGDDHEIRAPITSGSISQAKLSVELVVDAQRMQVLDPNLSAEKRAQVQQRMLGPDVLDPQNFPQIAFHSVSIESGKIGQWSVKGDLSLHGKTHEVTVQVSEPAGEIAAAGKVPKEKHFLGFARLKQTDFGIKPISIAGGTVKVKDEVKIDLDIWAR